MRRRLRQRSAKSSSSASAVRALALFAVLCGALLLAASFSVKDAESQPAERAPGPDPADIKRALEHLERASNALDSTDYGQVRFHLLESKYTLRRSVETN